MGTLAFAACGPASDAPDPSDGDDASAAMPTQGVYGTAPAAVGGIPSVITLMPESGPEGTDHGAAAADPVIDQFGLAFSPTRLIVHTGDTIRFTNSESALTHNVHVRSVDGEATLLDEDAVTGQSIDLTIADEGGYDVLCDMHPGMAAFIFVTAAPFAVFAEADGSFLLDGVPPGDYQVAVWTRDKGLTGGQPVTVATGATEVRLTPNG